MPSNVSQRNFLKGLSAAESLWAQPKNTLPRLSNLLLTNRGALRVCDGSLFISERNGTLQTADGPWTEIFLFQPVNVNRYYIGIKKDFSTHLGAPTGPNSVDAGAGGTLGAGTYHYLVTTLDGAGGESVASNETTVAIAANHKITTTWVAVTNSISYNVYRSAAGGPLGSETLQTNVT